MVSALELLKQKLAAEAAEKEKAYAGSQVSKPSLSSLSKSSPKSKVYADADVVAEVVVVAAPVVADVVVVEVVAKRGRGRPRKEVTLSKAEMQKRWRDKKKKKS